MKKFLPITTILFLAACSSEAGSGVLPASSSLGSSAVSSSQVKVKFRAVLIRKDGEQIPVARQDFSIRPYSMAKIRSELEKKSAAGKMPESPSQPYPPQPLITGSFEYTKYEEAKKKYDQEVKEYEEAKNRYEQELIAYREKTLPDWQKKVYAGLQDEVKRVSSGKSDVDFKTDLDGNAEISLAPGTWYISGSYDTGGIFARWNEAPIEITSETKEFELSNDSLN